MPALFRNLELRATTDPIYEIKRRAYRGSRPKPMEDPAMLNTQNLTTRFLAGTVAALAASVLIVLASLTHAMTHLSAYA
jgi:hypothetical protein